MTDILQYYQSLSTMNYVFSGVVTFLKFVGCLVGGFYFSYLLINRIFVTIFKRPIQCNNTLSFLSVILAWALAYTVMKHDRDTVVSIVTSCIAIPQAEFIKETGMCMFAVKIDKGYVLVSVDRSYNLIKLDKVK